MIKICYICCLNLRTHSVVFGNEAYLYAVFRYQQIQRNMHNEKSAKKRGSGKIIAKMCKYM